MEVWFTKEIAAGVAGAVLLLVLVLLLWNIVLTVKFGGLKKRFRRLAQGSSKENLEQILEKLFSRMEALDESQREVSALAKEMRTRVREQKGNLGIVRFCAFEQEGSDLSFSLALVDEAGSGMVITSIYGRHESRVYAKPVEAGHSSYTLSEEEQQALEAALKSAGRE